MNGAQPLGCLHNSIQIDEISAGFGAMIGMVKDVTSMVIAPPTRDVGGATTSVAHGVERQFWIKMSKSGQAWTGGGF
jgi:hypothetical protein